MAALPIRVRGDRTARFVTIPRNRLVSTLVEGHADGICYVTPAWLGNAPLRWSRPLIPNRDWANPDVSLSPRVR